MFVIAAGTFRWPIWLINAAKICWPVFIPRIKSKTQTDTGAACNRYPKIILIDEIDKAPRDFPNDLLHELDKMEFTIVETGKNITSSNENRPIVFITSNSERRLPEPFLRRCIYHNIDFDKILLKKVIEKRRNEFESLSDEFIKMAIKRFISLREKPLRKIPSTGEFLVWLHVLAIKANTAPKILDRNISHLSFLSTLLKDHADIADLKKDNEL